MYCTKCGKAINDDVIYCPYCGAKVIRPNQDYYQNEQGTPIVRNNPMDTGNFGWGILGFFLPIVGLILWLVWKDERPLDAKMAGRGALIHVIIIAVLTILFFILIGFSLVYMD